MNTASNDKEEQKDNVIPQIIEDEMKSAYLDYSMSVIVGRALPDVRDGLKPVHRRILFAMNDMGMKHTSAYKKCARIVGEVLGKYHPHGDSAVYDSLVRMAQEFSLRYPLVQGQGNFGSVDGDSAAAMRYTEARMAKISQEMLQDIEKETVKFTENFDGSLEEPSVLPSKIPNLLMNGSTGIAVGMATNIPPHNLNELAQAVIKIIEDPEVKDLELMEFVKGPDFPTGGQIVGRMGIKSAYATGRGKVLIRSKMHDEEKNGKQRIIVTEIPFMVNKAELIIQIADLVKDKRIEGISDLRDESDRKGMRIVIELKRDATPELVKNQLLKYSRMQDTFGIIFLALVNGQPRVLTLKQMLSYYLEHRKIVVIKRIEYDLRKAEERAHILEGLIIALEDIDNVISLIKASSSAQEAKESLMQKHELSEIQSAAILDMKLQKLAKLESGKIKDEHADLQIKIKNYKEILADELKIYGIIKDEQLDIIKLYGDERKTEILDQEDEDLDIEDLIEEEDVVVTVSNVGYVKRMPLDTYKAQRRGGTGIIGTENKDEDYTEKIFIANTHSYLLVLTDTGKVHWVKVYKIPESGRYSKGKAIINLIEIEKEEHISAILPVREFSEDKYLLTATRKGIVKKTSLAAYSKPRKGGIIALTLDDGDEVVSVAITDGSQQVLLATQNGNACKFKETDARPIGRTSRGVTGIRLKGNDKLVSMILVDEDTNVLTLTSKGYGKQTKASEYRLINRGGSGVININLTDKNGQVVTVRAVNGNEDLMLITKNGMIVRTPASGISVIGRNTQGVRVVRLREGDQLVACGKIINEEEADEELEKEEKEIKKNPKPIQKIKESDDEEELSSKNKNDEEEEDYQRSEHSEMEADEEDSDEE
ncbi:DNA gyrase subunit A [Candidatus Woesearchaeota archaeon]|nr:DNA gyrase subunit A [Candidatus Woesearchaeota archaeon]MCF7901067.1 DNA gyrase subunit A [Candidatus Woesearchaeota archaeon]MCF8013618.1 DNA gyrase subunit A [Candidatus Woesearchaeota archaeon]